MSDQIHRFGEKAGSNLRTKVMIVRRAIPICTAPVARQIKRDHLQIWGQRARKARPSAGMGQRTMQQHRGARASAKPPPVGLVPCPQLTWH